ncbi:IS4 family transposase [Saccharopolyspora sp. ASAGF58]|uniref:IS4 family transposase n=1 Tax=Saccharopolyspora sp. ASAGF58 TaxID=2719023 RepID=UPI00143FD379|nr:IS4 family transposase [Saccharopolyspora sp. ASAGF58]QIZ35135.1 IS4 family transposase [Saccharopolyspora sp. ASAGF58]QIZ35453.1 IS4 family transposase [Saccharopolyspora sp. ASAGF58]QIZ36251.1 IS4 family transposase [Saccharopolyspora sp. ASAGF58]QIZ39066.1 IS4 family transposase [Saccharopolyspora sp. ASAGF58]QIZ39857.1 IS4 family transposase [Saccharopolyspora sp. ASAGF58]
MISGVVDDGVVAGARLTDLVSLGVLASSVPRDVVDEVIVAAGRQAKRSDGKLPPHVMVYFVMAMALFATEDYEEVAARLTDTLAAWGCWDQQWSLPTSGGITQARQRLGAEPLAELFARVAVPVAGELTRGAFLGPWRLMAIDGFEWDAPDTKANGAEFGYGGSGESRSAFPKVRVVSVSECGSHAMVDAEIGGVTGKGSGEQTLARRLYRRLQPGWLLIADRNFYTWQDWCTAADTGAELLWRVKSNTRLPVLGSLYDGSYRSVLIEAKIRGRARQALIDAAARGEDLPPDQARIVRVVEYTVPDRDGNGKGELIRLITTITDPTAAPAAALAESYHHRWEHETANGQIKTVLRGPGRVLRSKSPDMVRQELYGYLLTHYAISALICRAATEADIDPDRVKFTRTVRIVRRRIADPAAFSP